MIVRGKFGARANATVRRRAPSSSGIRLGGTFYTRLLRPVGPAREAYERGDQALVDQMRKEGLYHEVVWEDRSQNIVVNVGLQHILDILFISATAQIDPWFVGITNAGPTFAATDTMASHGGWTENQNYNESVRQTYVDVRAAQTVSNVASRASFAINTNGQSLGGAFLTSDNTKGGTSGTLLSGVAFTGGNKAADSGDTLEVQYDFSAADDGV